ncbi:tetratricopeptide repeat protein, partial [Argonema antarcticum]|uniref:tetratricopeptide repeat protein n=1 Tax=Argonema antarcticum TaxID=2942763 RepID=UPI0020135843|nr:tetratricopeptide repeat protein [Argonema antarcticum A004/B2]
MDETRAQAYANLIQQLLSCPNGEEPQILQANSELIDGEFLQVCQIIAENLAGEGQENAADFLRSMASQLGELLGMNDEEDSDNSEGENPRKYLEFIQELLQAEEESNSDIAVVYPIIDRRKHLLNARFAEILQQVAANFIAEHPEATREIVAIIENLSIDISNFPRGKRANNIEIEIAGYQIVLSHREPGSEKWAQTQNNLAAAYYSRIRGERAENIEKAIEFYTAALTVRTPDAFPENWAMTQNNLAAAYYSRIRGERAENIEKAIEFYTAALTVRTPDAFPENWAMTQNNLAAAYYSRIRGERAENIEKAIEFYTAALTVRT